MVWVGVILVWLGIACGLAPRHLGGGPNGGEERVPALLHVTARRNPQGAAAGRRQGAQG